MDENLLVQMKADGKFMSVRFIERVRIACITLAGCHVLPLPFLTTSTSDDAKWPGIAVPVKHVLLAVS